MTPERNLLLNFATFGQPQTAATLQLNNLLTRINIVYYYYIIMIVISKKRSLSSRSCIKLKKSAIDSPWLGKTLKNQAGCIKLIWRNIKHFVHGYLKYPRASVPLRRSEGTQALQERYFLKVFFDLRSSGIEFISW